MPHVTADDREAGVSLPPLPSLVLGQVHHVRHRPLRHTFTHRHYTWLVDLAAPPRLPVWLRPFASFDGRDHLGGHADLAAVRSAVLELLRAHRIDVGAEPRVVMLAHPRLLGHVFNPMSAYWCLDPMGSVRGLVLEVHNTYGGRHAYVVCPDERGGAGVGKSFFVSPFNEFDGSYRISTTLRGDLVAVDLRLSTDQGPLVSARVSGRPRPATVGAVVRTLVRHPLMPQRVSALIRVHGVWLWLRRLPVGSRARGTAGSIR